MVVSNIRLFYPLSFLFQFLLHSLTICAAHLSHFIVVSMELRYWIPVAVNIAITYLFRQVGHPSLLLSLLISALRYSGWGGWGERFLCRSISLAGRDTEDAGHFFCICTEYSPISPKNWHPPAPPPFLDLLWITKPRLQGFASVVFCYHPISRPQNQRSPLP